MTLFLLATSGGSTAETIKEISDQTELEKFKYCKSYLLEIDIIGTKGTGYCKCQIEVCDVRCYLPKTDDNYRTHKMMQMSYLDLWSMLLSGQVSYTSNSSHLFWNLKDLVLVQSVSYRKKITYHRLCIGFLHKLLSMHDDGHMLH